jgi:N-acetylglucosaminyl-diphospho-decaprenol L-rhamnosyltransferase
MDLSIIIVNWNSKDYLAKCLESVYSHTDGISYEVIVIDNASFDGCDLLISEKYPQTKFIQSDVNLGFGGANNLGYRNSTGKVLLFLNPDTEIRDEAINRLVYFLGGSEKAGAIGCRLLNTDLTVQTSCIQPFPTILNQLLDADYLKSRYPGWNLWGLKPLEDKTGLPQEVEVISGACFMVKRDAFEKAGLFGSDYFMYAEDVDLSYKIRILGYSVLFLNQVEIIHHGGKSSDTFEQFDINAIMKRESIYRFLKTYRGTTYAAVYRYSTALGALVRLIVLKMRRAPSSGETKTQTDAKRKWKEILSWSLDHQAWQVKFNNLGHS